MEASKRCARVELSGKAERSSDAAHDVGDESVEVRVGGILLAEGLVEGRGSASAEKRGEGGGRPSGGSRKEPRCPSRRRGRRSR